MLVYQRVCCFWPIWDRDGKLNPNIILVGFTWLHQSCLHFNTPFLHQCTVNRYCQVQGCLSLREKRSSHYFYWCDHIWFIYDSHMIHIWSGIWNQPRSAKTPRSLIASTWAIQGHLSTTVIRGMPHNGTELAMPQQLKCTSFSASIYYQGGRHCNRWKWILILASQKLPRKTAWFTPSIAKHLWFCAHKIFTRAILLTCHALQVKPRKDPLLGNWTWLIYKMPHVVILAMQRAKDCVEIRRVIYGILWIFKAQLITDCGHTIQFQLGGTLVESDDPTCVSSNKRPTMSVVEIPSSAQTASLPPCPPYVPPGKKSNLLNQIPCLWIMSERVGNPYGPTGPDILTSWLSGRSKCRSWVLCLQALSSAFSPVSVLGIVQNLPAFRAASYLAAVTVSKLQRAVPRSTPNWHVRTGSYRMLK